MESIGSPWRGLALDTGLVIALVILGIVTVERMSGAIWAAQLIVILPLLARRRWPFPVLLVVSGASVATSMSIETAFVPVAAVALASFTVGERAGDRVRSAMGVIAVAGFIALGFIVQDADPFEALVLPFVVVVPSWLVGDVVRTRRLDAAKRQAEAQRVAQENETRLRTAVAEERRAMARELHDVVAHGVSVMLIQSGAARQVIHTAPDLAEEALLTVEATGREAMAELRRLLGVLNDDGEATGLAPQPGVDQLGALVERVREAGLPTELSIDGSPRPLPASLDVTVYRIVQEALTNALRYARRAATLVHLSYDTDQLRLEILDDGPAGAADATAGSGRGLVGMQQRAVQVGGRLEAGPRLGGGYAVRAWLPLEPGPGG
ncbi:MAG TPA: sensor histidine kinase [Candidatus Limnocylindrales bacterium]